MYGVAHGSHQDPELVPPVDVLLLQAEDDGAEVLVVGEIVPVLGAVEIFLVGCLHHAGQLNRPGFNTLIPIRAHLKTAIFAPVFLNNGLLSTVGLLNYWQTFSSLTLISLSLLHGLEGPLLLLCLLQVLVNVDVGGGADHPTALYPVAGVWYEVVRVVLTELVRTSLERKKLMRNTTTSLQYFKLQDSPRNSEENV